MVYWRWVRVAIVKPSDEHLRKGETQLEAFFPTLYTLIANISRYSFLTCSRDVLIGRM